MLELRGITKSFPGVKALDNVSVEFKPGMVHALLGENGAGKSTLIKTICGIYQPDEGAIYLNGVKVKFRSIHDAFNQGINIVYQELQVIPNSTITESIMLDKMITFGKTGIVNWKKINQTAQQYMKMVGLDFSPDTITGGLSAGQKQLVQIAKALASDAKLLLLDEPTSSITMHEADNLFRIIGELKNKGVAIIFVSHKLEEVFQICDQVTVLRDGKQVGTELIGNLNKNSLIKMMIGRDYTDEFLGHLECDKNKKVLEAKNIFKKNKAHDVSFCLYQGEILGFYGLVGAGRTELAKLLIGEDKLDRGLVYINGSRVTIKSVSDSLYKHNMGYITENRKEEGLLLDFTVKTNLTITIWNQIIHRIFRFIDPKKETQLSSKMVTAMDIKVTGLDQVAKNLSGGNQQKISIAKWLVAGCDILIIDGPTIGVDVGAKASIHKLIWDLAKVEGKSIILISSDMPEMVKLARRILVFRDKKIVGEIDGENTKTWSYEAVSEKIGGYLA
jgi:ribose transport system ATP-binding protein